MASVQTSLSSPGVGARRKGPKTLPTLPISAFSPPNSGTSDRFPLPPSPSVLHPSSVVDAHVALQSGSLQAWSSDVGQLATRKVTDVVLYADAANTSAVDQFRKSHPTINVLSVVFPVDFSNGVPADIPQSEGGISVSLSTPFTKNSPQFVEALRWALGKGYVVDIDVQAPLRQTGEGWEGLEELLATVFTAGESGEKPFPDGAVVLSNILPPPHDLGISIVKLLNHPAYRAYQGSTASLSLFRNVSIKYLPPMWGAPTPATPTKATSQEDSSGKEKKEWKRRIKMYLGPAMEAFGYQRILYGSSSGGQARDWYEIARECFAELGVDEEGIDALFANNARELFGP